MHFWRGARHPIQDGQTAELAVAEMRIVGANGSAPDRSKKLLAQIGIDYYFFEENNTRAPCPGIGRYQELTEEAHLGLKPQVLEMSPLWGSKLNPVGVQFFSYGF
jgi:hypothetical protein